MSSLYIPSGERELTERERTILQAIVQLFVLHANPVGSRIISKYLERNMRLSAASVRNIMADLEASGYITHPHTSAGRMPTDKGYRMYVDALMELDKFPIEEHQIYGALAMSSRENV
jgi:heat-inducible transcriptional repressor